MFKEIYLLYKLEGGYQVFKWILEWLELRLLYDYYTCGLVKHLKHRVVTLLVDRLAENRSVKVNVELLAELFNEDRNAIKSAIERKDFVFLCTLAIDN